MEVLLCRGPAAPCRRGKSTGRRVKNRRAGGRGGLDRRRRDAVSDPFRHARMFRSVSGMSNSEFLLSWLRKAALGSGLRTKADHDSSAGPWGYLPLARPPFWNSMIADSRSWADRRASNTTVPGEDLENPFSDVAYPRDLRAKPAVLMMGASSNST